MCASELKNKDLLLVREKNGALCVGGDQHWYPKEGFLPMGACGATTASNMLCYMLRTRSALFDAAGEPVPKADYLEFMKKVYAFMYPRVGGLMVEGFCEGMTELTKELELPVSLKALRVPIAKSKRPSLDDVFAFIRAALEADTPVAFLILSSGRVEKLETWHWVTVIGLDESKNRVTILDNTKVFTADLSKWLNNSIMGGSFVKLTT
ncbi:MAG: BtrH N-terminal domain-containing protein [Defluviitaleaceae bacterium]|nr:BtrH N-terminal domain-containing protein [Defluviitaleaceae bacterium]